MRQWMKLFENEIAQAEAMWAGGVADFGDRRAAEIIRRLPGYDAYVEALRKSLRAAHGWPLVVYRSMPREAVEGFDGATEYWGVSLSQEVAKGFMRFAAHRAEQVLVRITLTHPEAIIMRGKPEEDEIVIDAGWIGDPDHIEIIS